MHLTSVRELALGTRRELKNWYTVAPLGVLVSPSRFMPRSNPFADSGLSRRFVTLRLRNGYQVRCRASEFPPFFEIFSLSQYDVPGIDWSQIKTIIDVGSNIGLSVLWFAARAPEAKIVAVEPSPDAGQTLEGNVARNELGGRVAIIHSAIGGILGRARIQVDTTSVYARLTDSTMGVEVPVISLSQILDDNAFERVDLLKIDCEGAEYDAFLGAGPALLRKIGAIVGEYHTTVDHAPREFPPLLEAAGFSVSLSGADHTGSGLFTATRPGA